MVPSFGLQKLATHTHTQTSPTFADDPEWLASLLTSDLFKPKEFEIMFLKFHFSKVIMFEHSKEKEAGSLQGLESKHQPIDNDW